MTEDTSLDVIAARYALGVLTVGESEESLKERGIPLPTRDQAAWTLLQVHLDDIASGRLGPEEGMRRIGDEVIRPMGMGYSTFKRPGESHDIGALLALEDEYDDIRRHELRAGSTDRRRPGVDARVVLEAREWLDRNGTRGGAPKLF